MMKDLIIASFPLTLTLSPWGRGKSRMRRVRGAAFFACFLMVCFAPSFASAAILNIQEVTSQKGIKAWLVEDHSAPVIAMGYSFKGAGAINDPDNKQGLSQILSNTMDEGAGDLDSKSFQGKLTDLSIGLSFNSSRDDFGGSLKTLSKYQDTAFDLLHLALTKPRFDKDPVARMIESNRVRIRSNMTDPEWMQSRLTYAILYKGHPYARNAGGTLSSLSKITPDDLRAKFKTQLARDNLVVAVAGDITKDELIKRLDAVFGDLPNTARLTVPQQIAISDGQEVVLYKQDIPQSVVSMVMKGISFRDADYHAAEVMDFIFGSSGFGSRLTEEIREKRGLTYGIYSSISEMDYSNDYDIDVSTRNDAVQEVIDLTKTEMTKMVDTPVTDKELKDAKTYLVNSVILGLTSTDRIAGAMLGMLREGLPKDYLDARATILQKITKEDVSRVAKRLLTPQNMKIILVGNPKIGDTAKVVQTLPDVE